MDLYDIQKQSLVVPVISYSNGDIQPLGDLRKLAGHNKNEEPKAEQMTDLIDGVTKIVKKLF